MSPASSTIVAACARPVDIVLTEPFAIAGGAPSTAEVVFVRIQLADGTVGYGEAAPFEAVSGENQATTLQALRSVLPALEGQDARRWRVLSRSLRQRLGRASAAQCGVEQAIIDALARHLGLPLVDFFGGSAGTLRTDTTITAGDVPHAVTAVKQAMAAGFGTVKVKVGAAEWAADVERLRAIHQAAPALRIIADANEGYSYAQARDFLRRLAADGVPLHLFEQPTAAERPEELRALQEECGIPVCADEAVRSPADALRIASLGGISALNVKLMKFGVVDGLDVIAIAAAAGMTCMIGGMVETAASMSFSAALAEANAPLFTYVDLDTPLFMPSGLIDGGLAYVGDVLRLPRDTPGTGVDLERWFVSEP